MSSSSFKINHKGIADYINNSQEIDKILKKEAEKVVPDFKKRSERAEYQMKEVFPGYKVKIPKDFTVEKGENTDRLRYLVTNENITPADFLFNPYVGG